MDFSGSAGAASSFDTIPAGQVAFAILTVRGTKGSAAGGQYLDCELVIDAGQPFAGRKVWDMIGDPMFPGNSEAYRQMGNIAITRILEAGRGAGPNNMTGYQINNYSDLSGLRVAVKLGIETGTGGHPDKNKVTEYLTPNPASQSGHKGWQQLAAGNYNTATAKPAAQQTGFGGFGASSDNVQAQPANTNGFGGAASTSGFQQPAGNATNSSTTTTSPSDPAATPGWLAQAG